MFRIDYVAVCDYHGGVRGTKRFLINRISFASQGDRGTDSGPGGPGGATKKRSRNGAKLLAVSRERRPRVGLALSIMRCQGRHHHQSTRRPLIGAVLLGLVHAVDGLSQFQVQRPFCIGVAGATASGKSSVVQEIVRLLDAEERVASVTQDCFYKNLSPEEREQAYQSNYNFDHPSAFDWPHQLQVLRQLREGAKSVAVPTYDFVTHSRLSAEHDTTITAPEIVIFEGILAMHDEEVRDLFDLKVFVDADADVRLARRIKRDMEERGRDLSGILEQYERFVKPATESFVVPTKTYADIVVPRGLENTVAIEMLAQHINSVLVQRELAAEAAEQDWDSVENMLKMQAS